MSNLLPTVKEEARRHYITLQALVTLGIHPTPVLKFLRGEILRLENMFSLHGDNHGRASAVLLAKQWKQRTPTPDPNEEK